jgi:hypothetical protein
MPISKEQEHFNAARQFQAHYDETLQRIGVQAPQPILGQTCNDYRRETLRHLKRTFLPHAHNLYQVQYRGLRADALRALEPQLLTAVIVEANNPATVEPGQFRRIPEHDQYGHVTSFKFIGPESFVKSMGRPGRRVLSFNTPNGPVDASGRFLR